MIKNCRCGSTFLFYRKLRKLFQMVYDEVEKSMTKSERRVYPEGTYGVKVSVLLRISRVEKLKSHGLKIQNHTGWE